MKSFVALSLAFLAVGWTAAASTNPTLVELLRVNAVVQILGFVLIAAIPTWWTGRMSWVDIAWPFGVAFIGAAILAWGDGYAVRRVAVGSVYLLIGLRMGLGALGMARATGVIVRTEFPRYP